MRSEDEPNAPPRLACRSSEQEWELSRSPDRTFGPRDSFGIGEVKLRNPLQELLDRNGEFHAREVRTDATMYSEAEGRMAVRLAVNNDLIGVRENRGISVGRREGEQHH